MQSQTREFTGLVNRLSRHVIEHLRSDLPTRWAERALLLLGPLVAAVGGFLTLRFERLQLLPTTSLMLAFGICLAAVVLQLPVMRTMMRVSIAVVLASVLWVATGILLAGGSFNGGLALVAGSLLTVCLAAMFVTFSALILWPEKTQDEALSFLHGIAGIEDSEVGTPRAPQDATNP